MSFDTRRSLVNLLGLSNAATKVAKSIEDMGLCLYMLDTLCPILDSNWSLDLIEDIANSV